MKQETIQPVLPEFCEVCKRVRWGNYQILPFNKWRHEECYPGSQNWLEFFRQLSPELQAKHGNYWSKAE